MLHVTIPWSRVAVAMSLLTLGSLASMTPASGAAGCADCTQLLKPHKPFRIYGNTWFVGTEGLSAILITSDAGHVLIDSGLPESASIIKANIEALGFRLSDLKAILNSHAHADQAGGLAELQRQCNAAVYVLRPAEDVLRTGKLAVDDPQYDGKSAAFAPVLQVWVVADDQLLGVGSQRLRVAATPGHAPGGASWSWESCEGGVCLNLFYAGDLAAVGAGKYRFKDHPAVLQAFESSFRRLETSPCDVLLTSRPEASQLFQRLDPGGGSRPASIKDDKSCARYAQSAREALAKRVAGEH